MREFDTLTNEQLFGSYFAVDALTETVPVPERPAAEIETDLGTVILEFHDDGIDARIPALTNIFTVDYLVHGTIRLSDRREAWVWSDYTYRAYLDPQGTIRTYPGYESHATDAAMTRIREAILPPLEAWLETHDTYLAQGLRTHWERAFTACENKLRKQEMKLAQRREWLRRLRQEYARTGAIASEHDRRQLTNTSGNDWWIR